MMGQLTADMTRLVGEIQTAHGERHRLIGAITQATIDMKRTTARMHAGFRLARAEMSRRQQRARREFVLGLRNCVGSLRDECRTDLAGARAVWHGAAATAPVREHAKRGTKAAGR